jgi:hypothetical protein
MPSKKKDGGALREQCSFWNNWGAVLHVMVELRRFHTKSRSSVPKGTLLPQCSKRNTAPKFLKNGPFLVSFPVIIMTLRKNRYRTGTTSLTVCLDTRKGQQNNISQPTTQPFTPPSSSTTMTDNYNANVAMVYDNKSIDLIKPNEELPNFTDLAWNIQNRASHCVGLELKEARLFCEFFGTSIKVVKILWELVVHNKLRLRGGAPGASALGTLFYEGVPQAGPGFLGHWRVCQRRQPEDPPQMGLGICQGNCQA